MGTNTTRLRIDPPNSPFSRGAFVPPLRRGVRGDLQGLNLTNRAVLRWELSS